MSAKRPPSGSDLLRVDAHVIAPEEYEDAPELTAAQIAAADLYQGGRLVQRGRRERPRIAVPRTPVALDLDADIVAGFMAKGPEWRSLINEALRRHLEDDEA